MTIFGGIFIAAYCHVILLIMSGIFMVAGSLLTAISYRPKSFGEDLHDFYIRQACIILYRVQFSEMFSLPGVKIT